MNIFISSDDRYIYAARVMLTSFFVHHRDGQHHIWFLHGGVREENLHLLQEIVEHHHSVFHPVRIDDGEFQAFASSDRFPVNVYYRFLIPQVAPDEEERALWLDVDLVVNGRLDGFYYQDMQGCTLAACADIENRKDKLQALDCPEGTVYFNSGVLLFDLKRMRRYQLSDYHEFYRSHEDSVIWPDQDILNGMFAGKIRLWDCDMYNVQVSNWRFHGQYDLEKSAIIHYVGNSKPWLRTYTNDAARVWDCYHAIAFQSGKKYILCRRLHRLAEKWLTGPFRRLRGRIYEKNLWVKKLRDNIRNL